MFPIDFSGEVRTDAIVAERLIIAAGGMPGRNYQISRKVHGKHQLDTTIPGLMAAALYGRRLLVLRDLDRDARCAGALAAQLAPDPPASFCLRIVVRAAEAWMLADREGISQALGIPARQVPAQPEELVDPKSALRRLGAEARDREARRLLGGTHQQAQGWMAEFLTTEWQPERAAVTSPSLDRAFRRLRALASS